MNQLGQFYQFIQSSWSSYTQIRKKLWESHYFLLLSPIAAIILWVFILGLLNRINLLSDARTVQMLSSGWIYIFLTELVCYPFLYICTQVVVSYLKGEAIEEDPLTLSNIRASKKTFFALAGTLLLCFLLVVILNYLLNSSFIFAVLKLLLLPLIILTIVCSLLCLHFIPPMVALTPTSSYQLLWQPLVFAKKNITFVIGLIFTLYLSAFIQLLPLLTLAIVSTSSGYAIIAAFFLIPAFFVLVAKLQPYWVFLPTYLYMQLEKGNRSG